MTALRVRLLALLAPGAVALLLLLVPIGGGLIEVPRASWSSMGVWYQQVGPAGLAEVVLWLIAVASVVWIVAGSALQLAATFSLRPGTRRFADAMSPALVRRLVRGSAGVATAVGLAIGPVATSHADDPPGVAVMEALGPSEDASTGGWPEPASPSTTSSSTVQSPGSTSSSSSSSSSTTTTTVRESPPAPQAPSKIPAPSPPAPSVEEPYVVAGGDCFWSIAERAMAAGGGPVQEADLIAYWRRIIDRNRSRLVAPDNPDLLYPGQVLSVPPP